MRYQAHRAAAAILFLLCQVVTDDCAAARIYKLVDYPALQNGYTLNGTITVADTATDDSVLAVSEVLSWNWRVSGAGQLHASGNSPPQINSIVVTENAILFPLEAVANDAILRLRDPTLTGRTPQPTLLWYHGFDDEIGELVPTFTAGSATDVFVEAWSSRLVNNGAPYLVVARYVPEPATSMLTIGALLLGGSVRQRHSPRTYRSVSTVRS